MSVQTCTMKTAEQFYHYQLHYVNFAVHMRQICLIFTIWLHVFQYYFCITHPNYFNLVYVCIKWYCLWMAWFLNVTYFINAQRSQSQKQMTLHYTYRRYDNQLVARSMGNTCFFRIVVLLWRFEISDRTL